MKTVMIYNFHRIHKIAKNFILYFVLTVLALCLAIYMSEHPQTIKVAYPADLNLELPEIDQIEYHEMAELPSYSDLVLHYYDAYITTGENGIEITSIHGEAYEQSLRECLVSEHPVQLSQGEQHGKGVTILGFMMMFLLMQAFTNMALYDEDKETKILVRILATPLSFMQYLIAQFFCSFILSFLPTFVTLCGISILGVDLGFSLFTYTWLILLLSALGSSFALFIYTYVDYGDDANMIGSAALLITSLLSGSIVHIQSENTLFQVFTTWLPQRSFVTLLEGLEQGSVGVSMLALCYLLCFIVFMLMLSIWGMNRKLRH